MDLHTQLSLTWSLSKAPVILPVFILNWIKTSVPYNIKRIPNAIGKWEEFHHVLAQLPFENPIFWCAIFFISGLVAVFIVVLIAEIVIRTQRSRLRHQAKAAGVNVTFPKRIGADPWAIEGCGTCIVFIIIMILVSLGISLPQILTQIPEALVVSVVLVIFGALWWSLVIASVPLTRRNYLNQQRAFNAAMQLGTGSSPNSEEP